MRGQSRRQGDFFGTTKRSKTVRSFVVKENVYDSSTSLPMHDHRRPHFCFVMDGAYTEEIDGNEHLRQPDSLMFYGGNKVHSELHHSNGRHLLIEVTDYGLAESEILQPSRFVNLFGDEPKRIANRISTELSCHDDVSCLAIEGLSLELLSLVARQGFIESAVGKPWIECIARRLREQIESPPSVVELAQEVHRHPSHVSREFRRRFGVTMAEFVRSIRIEKSIDELTSGTDSIAHIACGLGFSDQSQFSRCFKKKMGVSPSTFRRLSCFQKNH